MKKIIFGALTALFVSGFAIANDVTMETKINDNVKQMKTYCKITVKTTHPNGTVTYDVSYYEVSNGSEGVKQCNAIKAKVEKSLNLY
jgi:outer membrane lipoprotein-sorting protein